MGQQVVVSQKGLHNKLSCVQDDLNVIQNLRLELLDLYCLLSVRHVSKVVEVSTFEASLYPSLRFLTH